ncbi:MAG: hypothetical protein JSV04_10415 [Candidatus Heimdallarchaeota archaeon]|nr:MAG: hypothetical protein JSV04_10415 [Candidatus Heimdallarchaeota archaeon]
MIRVALIKTQYSTKILFKGRNSTLPSTNLYDAFKEGESRAKEWKEKIKGARSLADAFEDNFVFLSPDTFVNTEAANRLSVRIGEVSKSEEIITIIGPQRSGKSTAVRQLANELNEHQGKGYAQYVEYDSHFWSWWEETDFKSTKFFFFDNIYPIWANLTRKSYLDLLNRSDHPRVLIVNIINSTEHHWLRFSHKTSRVSIFGTEPFEFHFKRPSILEIENIIKARAESLGKLSLFPAETLKTIGELSLGLPGLALWLVRSVIADFENQENQQKIPSALVHKVAQFLGFVPALKIILEHDLRSLYQEESGNRVWPVLQLLQESSGMDSTPLTQSLKESKGITTSWKPLLEEMLLLTQQNDTIRRSELQERTGIKESSLTYQCQNLIKEKIITYSKSGREVFYQLRTPVKEALELALFNK